MAANIERLHSVKRLLAAMDHTSRLMADGSTPFRDVNSALEHVRELGLTARLRILLFAFIALGDDRHV